MSAVRQRIMCGLENCDAASRLDTIHRAGVERGERLDLRRDVRVTAVDGVRGSEG